MGSQRLRVGMALQYYLPHRTGLTLHVARLAAGLARRGHEVEVVASRHDRALPSREVSPDGVRIRRLPAAFHVSRGVVMPTLPLDAARLARGVDVLHLHAPLPEGPLWAALARRHRLGLLVTHHGDLVLPGGWADRGLERLMRRLFDAAARRAHRVLAYSEDYRCASAWLRPWRDRCVAVPPPIEIPVPRPDAARARRKQLLAGGSGPLLGFAGRFVQEKRPDLLIAALERLRQRWPEVRVAFAGAHRLRYERFFERQAAAIARNTFHLRFLGPIEEAQELADFYAACDVIALPSDTECMGLVQVEAMLCGTPVVATAIPGARDVVHRTGMGLLVPPGDPDALAAGIARLVHRRARYVRPRQEIEAHYDPARTLDRVETLLQDAVRAARA